MTSELISKWQSVGFTHGKVSTVIAPYLEHCLFVVSSVAAISFVNSVNIILCYHF